MVWQLFEVPRLFDSCASARGFCSSVLQQPQLQDEDDDDDDMVFVNTINLSKASLRSVYAVPSHMPAQWRLSISRRITTAPIHPYGVTFCGEEYLSLIHI